MAERFTDRSARSPAWKELHRIADSIELEIRAAFLETVAAIRDGLPIQQVRRALAIGNQAEALRLVQEAWELGTVDLRNRITAAQRDALERAAQSALERLSIQFPAAAAAVSFDVVNPRIGAWLQTNGVRFVQELSEATRQGIAQAVIETFASGRGPADAAMAIRDAVGLTDRQVATVARYREFLEGLSERRALDSLGRESRRRLARGLLRRNQVPKILREGLAADRLDDLVDRYAERLIRERALVISRTASIDSAAAGQNELWLQKSEQGAIDSSEWIVQWVVTPDDRLCPVCQEQGSSFGFRRIDGIYQNGVSMPTRHPQCRCGEQLVRISRVPERFRSAIGVEPVAA